MAWNNSGDNDSGKTKPKDPWGGNNSDGGNRGRDRKSGDNNGGGNSNKPQPPEIDKIFKDIKKQFEGLLGGKKPRRPGTPNKPLLTPTRLLAVLVLALAAVFVFSGFYQIPSGQTAVVLSQGKAVTVSNPGVHWRNPLLTHYRLITIGAGDSYRLTSELATADGSLLKVGVEVDYKITDAAAFVTSVDEPVTLLQNLTLATLRQQIGQQQAAALLSGNAGTVATSLKQGLHTALGNWSTGIDIDGVTVSSISLPKALQEASPQLAKTQSTLNQQLASAQAAQQAQQLTTKSTAEGMLTAANAYSKKVVDEARGKTSRFTSQLAAYQKAPKVTRERLYMDTMEAVLSNTTKVLVMGDKGQQLISLPLAELLGKQAGESSDQTAAKAPATDAAKKPAAKAAPTSPPSLYGTSKAVKKPSGDAS